MRGITPTPSAHSSNESGSLNFLNEAWEGVVGQHWLRLQQAGNRIEVLTAAAVTDWRWLEEYLQTGLDLAPVLATFPDDAPMRAAVAACPGLRLLRQDPWECLASFICSSTKQIVQIQQIVELLCQRFGEPVAVPPGLTPVHAFPTAERVAGLTEADLRGCKMGFRAPNLLAAARRVANRVPHLDQLATLSTAFARNELMRLPGVGPKIADCVLLFAYGRQDAFPRDVWIHRALAELYFPGRRPNPATLAEFAASHFGPFAGYAQQYLFHYIRVHKRRENGQAPRPT